MPTLDLRHSAWIPVREQDGTERELGLQDILLGADKLREIRDPFPIVEFGIYRLLVALVMDIYSFKDRRDFEDLLQAGTFDSGRINNYFEANKDRFDLFHPEHPFLQFAGMQEETDKPLSGLMPPIPSGTNANHFHHVHEAEFGVSPEAAARLLTTLAPFMTAGGAGLAPSINGSPPWYVLLTGETLFQTLCLNCCVLAHLPQGNTGVPAWRRNGEFIVERRQSASLLEGLTWQPRRILLIPGGPGCCSLTGRQSDVLVRSMKFTPGAAAGFVWTDPNVAYKLDAKGPMVLRPQEGKQVWRDVGPLALLKDSVSGTGDERVQFTRPRLVDQYAELCRDEITKSLVPRNLCLTLYGMRTDLKMKIFEWQRESLDPLPAPLVLFTQFGNTAQQEINRAGKVDKGLVRALKCAYPRDGKGNSKAFDSRIEYARRSFWNALRSDYWTLLNDFSAIDPAQVEDKTKDLISEWKSRLEKIGWKTLEEAVQDLESNMLLRTEVVVRSEFAKALYFALEKEGSGNKKGDKKASAEKKSGTPKQADIEPKGEQRI